MSEDNLSISHETLQKFVAGDLSEKDKEVILTHLAENEESLAIVDELWAQQSLTESELFVQNIEAERAQRIEKHIVKSIHRSNLALSVASLGTKGFFTVAFSLLKPLADRRQSGNKRSK